MVRRKTLGVLVLIFGIAVAVLVFSGGPAVAQSSSQVLTVAMAVCPEGYEGEIPSVDCSVRLARAYDVTVVDSATFGAIAEDVPAGEDGLATIDLSGLIPARLTIAFNTAIGVGSQGASCSADGVALDARLNSGAAAIPIVDVEIDTAANVACTVYIFGFPDDDGLLDIVGESVPTDEDGSTGTAEVDAARPPAETGAEVVALPNTGSGPSRNEAAGHMALGLALTALIGGLLCVRGRVFAAN